MKIDRTLGLVCLVALWVPLAYGSSERFLSSTDPTEKSGVSSSSSLPDAPDAAAIRDASHGSYVKGLRTSLRLGTRPFSAVAIAFTSGLGGLGVDVATPLATKVNLRLSASFLNYSSGVTADGIPLNATVKLRSVGAGVELFPYRSSFHITPGFTMYNGNQGGAVTNIMPGSVFTVDDTAYMSDVADPVHGTFNMNLGYKVAPSLTVGFGNMLRRDSHWSVPVDLGFQYIGQPRLILAMTGSTCDPNGTSCDTIASDPTAQANLTDEQNKINTEISPLRFYPILKIGLSYRFGRNVKLDYWH